MSYAMASDQVVTPAARHRILHLSDTHVTASGFDQGGVDAAAALDRILTDARHVPDLDLVVVSGDIADDGSEAGCADVLDRVGRFAAERGIPHVYSTGNHDTREAFAAVLGSGHRGPDGSDIGTLAPDVGRELAAVSDVGRLRVITLDSLVPGSIYGRIGAAQLAWLRDVLARPAAAGSIVVFHHPPVYLEQSPWMPGFVLRDPEQLGAVIEGSDVRLVLCGHVHHQMSGVLAGVPVCATPGIVTRIDQTAPPDRVRAVKGAGATVVDLGGPFSPLCHIIQARDPAAGEQVYEVDPVAEWVDDDYDDSVAASGSVGERT
jgi:3',5'-cyclic-AMP phosphodiesterase